MGVVGGTPWAGLWLGGFCGFLWGFLCLFFFFFFPSYGGLSFVMSSPYASRLDVVAVKLALVELYFRAGQTLSSSHHQALLAQLLCLLQLGLGVINPS